MSDVHVSNRAVRQISSSILERVAAMHARVEFVDVEHGAAITLARDLVGEGVDAVSVIRLAALEVGDGADVVRDALSAVVSELGIPSDSVDVTHALIRAIARAVEAGETTIEDAMERVAHVYIWSPQSARTALDLGELYSLYEDDALVAAGIWQDTPTSAREEFRAVLLELASRNLETSTVQE